MNNSKANIDVEAVLRQSEEETYVPKKKTEFSPKNYLQTRLGLGETSKKLTIRLLPFSPDSNTPFKKVHMHTVKVSKEVTNSGWRTFVCPQKNDFAESKPCPFCDTSEQAKKLRNESSSEFEKKKYGDIEFANRAKEYWIVRCIERGHEEDGVKFWLFTHSRKKDGVFDKITNLIKTRYDEGKEAGVENNILDLDSGKDLVVTITKDFNGKTSIQITDKSVSTPLSPDAEQRDKWVNDEKKWTDVFTVKPYEYMAIIVEGGVPVFDKETGKYIDKSQSVNNEKTDEDIESEITEQPMDFTKWGDSDGAEQVTVQSGTESTEDFNLPF